MQTGNISFCGKYALNIKSEIVKKQILQALENQYNIVILRKHFEIFNENISIDKMTRSPYMYCLKSNGNPYLMFLTRINNINTCILIDKKIQQGYFLPRMIVVHMMFNDECFENTLLDGEMVKDANNKWVFLINDIYVNCGRYLGDVNLIKRHNLIYEFLQNKFKPCVDLFYMQVKKLFTMDQLDYVVDIFKDKLNYTSRGLLFKPMFFKFKDILLNFDNNLVKQPHKSKCSKNNQFIEEPITNNEFVVKKTNTPDVYDLFNRRTNVFVGHACVNTLSVSKHLSELFKNASIQTSFTMRCVYNDKFKKWTPLQVCS